jgi:surface polysaccharide O-acyltransferase-like enzyme
VVSALSALLVSVMFAQTRLWVIGVGLLLLVWVPRLRMPKVLAICAAALAQASLFIYLVHWQVLDIARNWWAVSLSLLAGLAMAWVWVRAVPALRATFDQTDAPAAAKGRERPGELVTT